MLLREFSSDIASSKCHVTVIGPQWKNLILCRAGSNEFQLLPKTQRGYLATAGFS